MAKLASDWYRKAASESDRAFIEAAVSSGKNAFDILVELLNTRRDSICSVRETDYSSPSWAHLQAHRNGRLQELDFILSMIDLNK